MTYQIDILDPKANKILKDLADRKLISILKSPDDSFMKVVRRIRKKAAGDIPTMTQITKEVESVRSNRYARSKKG